MRICLLEQKLFRNKVIDARMKRERDCWWSLLLNGYYFSLLPKVGNILGLVSVHPTHETSNKSKIRTRLRAGFLMTPPTEWQYFEHPQIQVTQLTRACVWVRVCARVCCKSWKLGFILAYLLAKTHIHKSEKRKHEKSTGSFMTPLTQ